MIRFSFVWLGMLARASLVAATAMVAGCGSGAVSGPPTAPTIQPITITPSTATLYSELPSNFLLSGGNGTFVITSSDQAAIPISGTFVGPDLTIVPNPVATDTPVTLTVRDTGSSTPVTAALTVKPRTVNNVVTITPSSSQAAACGTALCAGGDAQVKAVLTQNGLPLANHVVNFQVISGDIRFITGGTSAQETLASSTSTTADASGVALVRIRASADAPAQTALLQVTDANSGFTQRASVTIAAAPTAALAASPSTVTFQGTIAGTCASNVSADVIVTGGQPPYQVTQVPGFIVTPSLVTGSGGRFTISPTGQCSSGIRLAVVDAAGASVTITLSNNTSTATAVPFAVSPKAVSLNSCSDVANVALVGGTGTYFGSVSGNGAVSATVSGDGRTGAIQRTASAAPGTPTVTVSFTDGKTTQDVAVSLTGAALGSCSASSSPLSASPATVAVTDCTSAPTVVISGGSGTYAAASSNVAIETVVSGNILTIRRKRPSDAILNPSVCPGSAASPPGFYNQCVTISDGTATFPVNVTVPSSGTPSCPALP